jgi:hypothetical protein
MATDYLLREQFVTNPTQILSEYVLGKPASPERATVTNQLIYAVMVNRQLVSWIRDYAVRHRMHPPPLNRALGDFGQAVVELGARRVVLALMRSSVSSEPVDFQLAWAALFGGARASPSNAPAEPRWPNGDTGNGGRDRYRYH